jgi:2'-5' RNA ligase
VAGWRSFVAVELSTEVTEGVRRVQGGLKERIVRVSWVRAEGIHLTLKFLGDVNPDRIEAIVSKVKEASQARGPFTIEIRGCGAFPNAKNPRVIWIGVDDPSGALRELQVKIEQGMEQIGFAREERGYTPHLTIGRLRSGKGTGGIAEALEASKESDLGTMEVREVCLFRSQLKPTGAEYIKLKVIPLRHIPG